MKKRRLEDLYIVGRETTVDDGNGAVTVWLQKLNPMEHEKAVRRANAARVKVLAARRAPDSDDWQEMLADADEVGDRDALIQFVSAEELSKRRESAEAELSFADEWKKDDYLDGLRDLWTDEENPMADQYAMDPNDEEARRVFLELKRFSDQVEEKVAPHVERLKRDFESVSDDDLRAKVADRMLEMKAGMEWLREFRACEVWFSTREPDDHKRLYFPDRSTVDQLADEVFTQLSEEYQKLVVAVDEGKASQQAPASSPSSAPPKKEEEAPSGLVAVAQ